MVTQSPQQFCVRWNSYQTNLQNAFPKLLISEHFVDVTLACESDMLKCHKIVLSACSTYFEKLLLDNPCQHPIIFMKDMKFQEMQSLVDFMYKGEVNVTQDDLPSLLKSAEALQIRGLCGSDQLLNQQQFGTIKTKTCTNEQQQQQQQKLSVGECTTTTTTTNKIVENNGKKDDNRLIGDHMDMVANLQNDMEPNDHVMGTTMTIGGHAQMKDDVECKEEIEDDSYYEGETDLMDTEFLEEEGSVNTGDIKPEFAIANVSCQYDGSPGSATNRRIRRSDEELRRAAECITRGQTFQTVSDQFNIPISTIRFYMARKGILPRRKRGRACSGPSGGATSNISTNLSGGGGGTNYGTPTGGNTSPIGPPYHIVHYKLPTLGVSKLK